MEIPDSYSPRHDDPLTGQDKLEDPDTGYQVVPTEDLEKTLILLVDIIYNMVKHHTSSIRHHK